MILRYKLCDFIKIHDDYVNDPMKGDFQKTLLLFHIGLFHFLSVQGDGRKKFKSIFALDFFDMNILLPGK